MSERAPQSGKIVLSLRRPCACEPCGATGRTPPSHAVRGHLGHEPACDLLFRIDMDEFSRPAQPDWYKDAVIYQVHVRTFFDGNDDGIGDFAGLVRKLDYLQALGINTIWILPFYPSPLRDDGYDIAHYQGVHPAYGTLRDVRRFLREAHARGLRVITELVMNHTSDQHPVVPGGAPRAARDRRRATSTCGAIRTASTRARASSSPTPRRPTGRGTRWPARTTGTASSITSPT